MYIFFNLGNNYSRGENMKMKRVKPLLVPMIYGVCVIAFLFCMYFAGRLSNNLLFKDKENTNYVDGEIVSEYDKDIPVVSTSSKIVRPYLDSKVAIYKTFYDYQDEAANQEESIIFYEDTYMQNSGVDYTSDSSFDVISILDGTVINVYENKIQNMKKEEKKNLFSQSEPSEKCPLNRIPANLLYRKAVCAFSGHASLSPTRFLT